MPTSSHWVLYRNGKEIKASLLVQDLSEKEAGVFETMRTYHGKIFQEAGHLERLMASAKTTGFPLLFTKDQLRDQLRKSLTAYQRKNGKSPEVTVRLTLSGRSAFVLMGQRKFHSDLYDRGVQLKTSPVKRSLSNSAFPEAKSSAYQNAVLASLEPRNAGIFEWLFLDRDGYVTEVRVGNIFIVADGEIVTPPTVGILNGLTRQFVIECVVSAGDQVTERPLMRHELYNASEAFLTNTSWEILPVVRIDNRQIGKGVPGDVTRKIHRKFKKRISEEYSK